MAVYEFQFSVLRSAVSGKGTLCRILKSAARDMDVCARSLAASPSFGSVPGSLRAAAASLQDQSRRLECWLTSLEEISRIWQQAEHEILTAAPSRRRSVLPGFPSPAETAAHGGNRGGGDAGEQRRQSSSPAAAVLSGAAVGPGTAAKPKAAIEPENSVKTRSGDPAPAEESSAVPENADHSVSDELCEQISSGTGQRPYSPPVFSTLDPLKKSAYIAAVAAALYKQFPSLSLSGSSRIEVPLGNGTSAYSSLSVTGSNRHSDHVKLSQAVDKNTGLLRENISISSDGSSVSFSKDGASVTLKTESGTWKVDPTSLSRTARVKLDQQTSISFTEKVNAQGYASFEKTVTSSVDGVSVSTSAGVRMTEPDRSNGTPTPVLAPGLRSDIAQRERMQAVSRLLGSALAGSPAGAAIPIPVPVG